MGEENGPTPAVAEIDSSSLLISSPIGLEGFRQLFEIFVGQKAFLCGAICRSAALFLNACMHTRPRMHALLSLHYHRLLL